MKPNGTWTRDEVARRLLTGQWIADLKLDGHTGHLEFDAEGHCRMFRLGSENTDRFPPLWCEPLANTSWQIEWCGGPVPGLPMREYAATLVAGGEVPNPVAYLLDQMDTSQSLRVRLQNRLCAQMALQQVIYPALSFEVPLVTQDLQIVDEYVAMGHEGWVIKDLDAPWTSSYDMAWKKYKPQKSVDAWVDAYTLGGGKYEGMVGSLHLKLRNKEGEWVRIGTCSGMSDGQRVEMKQWLDNGKGFVAEVWFQRWSIYGALLHASFSTIREDKTQADCSYEQQRYNTDPFYRMEVAK